MNRLLKAALVAALLPLAGCLDVEGANSSTITFDFNSETVGAGWLGGAADFPVGREAEVNLVADRRFLPAALAPAQSALYLSGTNVSGDLFLFHKKYLTGLAPLSSWRVKIRLEIVSNIHGGCTTGAGPLTVIKAGLAELEPLAAPDGQNVYRLSVNKGAGTAPGDYTQLGDIRNELTGCPSPGTYAFKVTSQGSQGLTMKADGQGGFWIYFGTQSSFTGSHEIYITAMQIVLSPA